MITLSCKEAARLECISLDRPLTAFETLKLKVHHKLCKCPCCGTYKEQLDCFEDAIEGYKKSMECCEKEHKRRLCEEAKERMCEKIRQEQASQND